MRKLLTTLILLLAASIVHFKASAQMITPELLSFLHVDSVRKALPAEVPRVASAIEMPRASVTITPNPVFNNASLILTSEETGNIACLLYDAEGRNIRSFQFKKDRPFLQQILPMYDLPKGEYLLNIVGKNLLESRKIVKQ